MIGIGIGWFEGQGRGAAGVIGIGWFEGQGRGAAGVKAAPCFKEHGKDVRPVSVLLLHGAKYTSADWDRSMTIEKLTAAGYHVYAIDLPGSGRSKGTVDLAFQEKFLFGMIAKLELTRYGTLVLHPSTTP